ncbi:unnamed protein product [Colias eurytheme]|nr:unnamed protein product [Colias eurytheme]
MAKRRSVKKNVKEVKVAGATATGTKSNVEPTKHVEDTNTINTEAMPLGSASLVMMKMCRLCETKDGPFHNIFGAESMTAKKIDDIMPFVVAENDDLPHKICFRCSAKVEELYEFIQKCIKTQENLRKALGKSEPITQKVKQRTLWEEKLNESNMSNDDICNALIRKAMEGIKDIPIMPLIENDKEELKKDLKKEKDVKSKEKENKSKEPDIKRPNTRHGQKDNEREKEASKLSKTLDDETEKVVKPKDEKSADKPNTTSALSFDYFPTEEIKETPKPFNIMDHVSTIKVNGVGILFQCKLCNRNFLKKEVVMTHGCSKNGGKKIAEEVKTIAPEPPKIPLIKYINTKPKSELMNKPSDSPISIDDDDDEDDKPLVLKKPKPRIGPASKVRRNENKSPVPQMSAMSTEETAKTIVNAFSMSHQQPTAPLSIQSPSLPLPMGNLLNNRYKLVPGPNNSFMLVEDKTESAGPSNEQQSDNTAAKINVPKPSPAVPPTLPSDQPYPVRLIKKVSHDSPYPTLPGSFTTPAMKKQSYTVVQTGNPSKLLISTKPPAEEIPKKKTRKSTPGEIKQTKPHTQVVESDNQAKNSGFFTFVNVDPSLQPSYVLPTNNIIQESQISTSTTAKPNDKAKDQYTCNMCGEKFTREKKLLTHIQSHYNKMDEEDQLRAQKNPKKRKSNNT